MALYEMRQLLNETGVPLFFHELAMFRLYGVPPSPPYSVLCARSVTWIHVIRNPDGTAAEVRRYSSTHR